MFTSKKALYLNGKFEKISPIINIDTLYYELVTRDSSNNLHVERRSVPKHMPILFNMSEYKTKSSSYGVAYEDLDDSSLINSSIPIILNTNIKKHNLDNPWDDTTHTYRYETNLYEINTSTYIDLHNILINIPSIYEFNESDCSRNTSINELNSSYIDTCILFDDVSTLIHDNNIGNTSNNDIYTILYYDVSIKVLNISTNNINNIISLDESNASTSWINFHYDVSTSKITHLCDINYNEGDFDFYTSRVWIENMAVKNNRFLNINDVSFIHTGSTYTNNEIYNSSHIKLCKEGYMFVDNICSNNVIINSTNTYINGASNKVINSDNNGILGNNNTIINCDNCSISIIGNNNLIMNLSNITLNVNNDNVIIGDVSSNTQSTINFKNNKLFLNESIIFASLQNLNQNCIVFGSSSNKVDVYLDSIYTLK